MAKGGRFEQRYETGDTPWDIGKPDLNLMQAVTATPIQPCKALDIGCGTGDNTIWLSRQRFQVVGVDASETAIAKAREKALQARVACTIG
jgi:2-polyprenyl-3-methyl-5-hydroxy-6-metoxy-1,4-benzoquinol methylase